jgi:phosphatidylglycerophosphate synthase
MSKFLLVPLTIALAVFWNVLVIWLVQKIVGRELIKDLFRELFAHRPLRLRKKQG